MSGREFETQAASNMVTQMAAMLDDLTPELVDKCLSSPDTGVRLSLARRKGLPEYAALSLSCDREPAVLVALARNKCAPVDVLRSLAASPFPAVRAGVASNPSCPQDLILVLANDSKYEVSLPATISRLSGADVLAMLHLDTSDEFAFAVASHPSAPEEAWEFLASGPSTPGYQALAFNKEVPLGPLCIAMRLHEYDLPLLMAVELILKSLTRDELAIRAAVFAVSRSSLPPQTAAQSALAFTLGLSLPARAAFSAALGVCKTFEEAAALSLEISAPPSTLFPLSRILAEFAPAYCDSWEDAFKYLAADPAHSRTVEALRSVLSSGSQFEEPVVLSFDSAKVSDGMHRITAAFLEGAETVPAVSRENSVVRANSWTSLQFSVAGHDDETFEALSDAVLSYDLSI